MKRIMATFLCLGLLTSPTLAERGLPRWDLDNRRCRVVANYDDGTAFIIINDDGELQIDVPGLTGQRGDKEFSDHDSRSPYAQIDGGMKIMLEPLRALNGTVYGYRMGKYEELAPIIANGGQLYVGSGSGKRLSQVFDLTGSRKAMKFLKKCQRFWERWHQKRK